MTVLLSVDAPLTSTLEGATKVKQSRSVRDTVIDLTSSDRMYTPTKTIDLTKDDNDDYPGCVPVTPDSTQGSV